MVLSVHELGTRKTQDQADLASRKTHRAVMSSSDLTVTLKAFLPGSKVWDTSGVESLGARL